MNYYDGKYIVSDLINNIYAKKILYYVNSWNFSLNNSQYSDKYRFNVNILYAKLNMEHIKNRYPKQFWNIMIAATISELKDIKRISVMETHIIKEKNIPSIVMCNDMIYVGK